MMTAFLNPFTMIAGAVLVLAPIIIHLINRLRYKRVHFAAMEFLLKSLKKNRRKLLLKQLLLLLLRCLLVALVGLLLARYIGAALGFGQPRGTLHVVLLDDTASMTDFWREDGVNRTSFDRAKSAIISDIVEGAAEAGTPQALEIIRLTKSDEPFRIDRLNNQSPSEVRSYLDNLKPTALHAGFLPGLEAAKRSFDRDGQSKRVLHVVSDFRARDWAGPTAEALTKAIPEAVDGKNGQVHFLDVAHPPRSLNRSAVLDHGNIGIVDMQPEARIAARFLPIEFTLTVANFTPASRKNVRVVVKINGQPREDASTSIAEMPPGISQHTLTASFEQLGNNIVSATLPIEEAGLAIDDLRYAVVEVREKVPLLMITTDVASRNKPEADAFYLRALFVDAARGFEVVERGPAELEQPGLDKYPSIFLINVPRLSDKAKANVEEYVRGGGGLFVSFGEQTDVDFYTRWHAEGKGLIPAPLLKATEPLNDAQRFDRMFDPALPPKAFSRSVGHPILDRIYRGDRNREVNTYLKFLFVDRYLPVPRVRWSPEPGVVEELFTLPNYRSVDDYKEPVQRLLNKIPIDDGRFSKYRDRLREYQRTVKEQLAGNRPLYVIADALDAMLNDSSHPDQPNDPNLREFWSLPELVPLRVEIQRFVETIRYGDPLVIAGRFGKGRVVMLTSTANAAWNDWPNGPARPFFVMLMLETQKYLASVGPDSNRLVGGPVELKVDAGRFEPRLKRFLMRDVAPDAGPTQGPVDLGEQPGQTTENLTTFIFDAAREPGVYRLEPVLKGEPSENNKPLSWAFAFNVDTVAEGDLRRASRDDLSGVAPTMQLHAPGTGLARILKDRKSDLSESPWFYLLLLGLLIAEQGLAVHLSYHLRGDASSAVNLGTRTVS
jgi:hypothetical protein